MRRTRRTFGAVKIEIGGDTFSGSPSKLIEKLDKLGEEAAVRGDHIQAQEIWQKSEYLKKEFDIRRNS